MQQAVVLLLHVRTANQQLQKRRVNRHKNQRTGLLLSTPAGKDTQGKMGSSRLHGH